MRIVLASLVVVAALSAGCGSTDREPSGGGWAPYPLPPATAWAPIDGSVGEPATAADATSFRAAVEAGLAPALAPRLGAARYLDGVEFEGSRLRLLLAPAGDSGWCLGLRGELSPASLPDRSVKPSCVLEAAAEPAIAVATLGGPLPAWMSREGGTLVYGRGRGDAARIEIELSDGTVDSVAPPADGTFAMGPYERDLVPRVVVARTAAGVELARVELWSESNERRIVEAPLERGATDSTNCARIGFPLTAASGTGYGGFVVTGTRSDRLSGNPSVMPAAEGGILLLGTLPEAARAIEVRFAAHNERHPVPGPCYFVGIAAERIASDSTPIAVVALGQDGAELETQPVRPTWLDFPPLP